MQAYVGTKRRLTFTATKADGTPVDPTIVTFEVTEPDGTKTTYTYGTDPEVVRLGTGLYYAEPMFDAPGDWEFWWYGAGNYVCADTVIITARGHVLT